MRAWGRSLSFLPPPPHYLFPTPARALASRRPFLFSRLHPWQVTILQTLRILAVLQATISKAFLRIHSNANILRKIKSYPVTLVYIFIIKISKPKYRKTTKNHLLSYTPEITAAHIWCEPFYFPIYILSIFMHFPVLQNWS